MTLTKSVFQNNLGEFLFTNGSSFRSAVKFKEELTCGMEAPEIRMLTVNYYHKR